MLHTTQLNLVDYRPSSDMMQALVQRSPSIYEKFEYFLACMVGSTPGVVLPLDSWRGLASQGIRSLVWYLDSSGLPAVDYVWNGKLPTRHDDQLGSYLAVRDVVYNPKTIVTGGYYERHIRGTDYEHIGPVLFITEPRIFRRGESRYCVVLYDSDAPLPDRDTMPAQPIATAFFVLGVHNGIPPLPREDGVAPRPSGIVGPARAGKYERFVDLVHRHLSVGYETRGLCAAANLIEEEF